ncbi:globoside alpha-1,3-N-acetylgalactosaminyltransferase 1-like [Latimeria chalumnae]|uniref:globoside alpha-1,3-N-acetylgalactosaminyltransferase 1-like n=1 Tax=Latimeria chalumnae TaxID=7897 RepID=UPI0003C16B4B|nr:PREDICTED: globoside alpha-1,3-N-acetylgalactosaminyltransferase 1-like isoform X1 [Latimeria chalumnae]|eukprot:XP_006007864.1 PREDICTED: globoside alpha-1,3-N-acetylgalactosaminyltransferase 1-like isoform X1 [Latimeria chalumnae]
MIKLSHRKRIPVMDQMNKRWYLFLFLSACVLFLYYFKKHLHPKSSSENVQKGQVPSPKSDLSFLQSATYWGAPIIWEKSLKISAKREEFEHTTVSVGLAVFAVGTYVKYLRKFIDSAEKYFMTGQFVTYYILTDNLRAIPSVHLGVSRELKPFHVAEKPDWVYLSKIRMSLLSSVIRELIQKEVDYVFTMDVDQIFVNSVGPEILGELVATLHPEFYNKPPETYPYERTSVSKAFVDSSKGDYYYTSELYGGLCQEVYKLAHTCSQFIMQDMEIDFYAILFEESYLNKYLVYKKPTKVLSPEYSWPAIKETSDEIQFKRILSLSE